MFDLGQVMVALSVWALPVLLAITLHEAAHAYVAWRLGDDTAFRLGRVSFNPVRHVDPVGTVMLPGALLLLSSPFLFGYAKPVPVLFANLRNPRWSMVLVAAAGPAANLALAFMSALAFHIVLLLPEVVAGWAALNLRNSILINLILAVFNMLPIPPLDGGRILVGLLPYRLALPVARLEKWGLLIIVALLFLVPLVGREIGLELDIFGRVVLGTVEVLSGVITWLTGLG